MKNNFKFLEPLQILFPKRLILLKQKTALDLFFYHSKDRFAHERFSLEDPQLKGKIAQRLKEERPSETLLVLSRSSVLQRELVFSHAGQESIENQLQRILPYSPREMAYSLHVLELEKPVKAVITALPDKQVREQLDIFNSLGFSISEIVTEDQCLWWFFQKQLTADPVLFADFSTERSLFVLANRKHLFLSREYPADIGKEEEVYSELVFSFFENGMKPARIIMIGGDDKRQAEMMSHFDIPCERGTPEVFAGKEIPFVFFGACRWPKDSVLSLLPHDLKIERRFRLGRKAARSGLMTLVLFTALLLLLGRVHLMVADAQIRKIDRKIAGLLPQVKELKQISAFLEKISAAQNSKLRILELLSTLAREVPPSVRVRNFDFSESGFDLSAESPSHPILSQTVQVFENNKALSEIKLEQTRLRKRLNREYFEFKLTGRWRTRL